MFPLIIRRWRQTNLELLFNFLNSVLRALERFCKTVEELWCLHFFFSANIASNHWIHTTRHQHTWFDFHFKLIVVNYYLILPLPTNFKHVINQLLISRKFLLNYQYSYFFYYFVGHLVFVVLLSVITMIKFHNFYTSQCALGNSSRTTSYKLLIYNIC